MIVFNSEAEIILYKNKNHSGHVLQYYFWNSICSSYGTVLNFYVTPLHLPIKVDIFIGRYSDGIYTPYWKHITYLLTLRAIVN